MLKNKKEKKECLGEGNYQGNLWQESYLVSQIKGMMRNIGQGQKETGDNGKQQEQEDKEQWKQ